MIVNHSACFMLLYAANKILVVLKTFQIFIGLNKEKLKCFTMPCRQVVFRSQNLLFIFETIDQKETF